MPEIPDHITVRLVPRGESEIALNRFTQLTPTMARGAAPLASLAGRAQSKCAEMGMESQVSPRNAINARIPREQFSGMFATDLEVRTREPAEGSLGFTRSKEYVAPRGQMQVPEAMREEVAFAYIPTPPDFYVPSFVPPNVGVYHLRLGDVVRASRVGPCHRQRWTGRGIRVGMVDSGFAPHPFFDDHGFNVQRVAVPGEGQPSHDASGHGTGISANTLMVAPDCVFFGVRNDFQAALALETALDQSPQILTNSWGWDVDRMSRMDLEALDPNFFLELMDVERVIAGAVAEGVTVVFAAGNGHRAFPGSMPDVISIGGTTVLGSGEFIASDYASSFVSQLYPGRQVPDCCGVVGLAGSPPLKGHIMLPVPHGSELEGENMPSSQQNKGWGIFSGTSSAAPQVAGIIALMLHALWDLDPNLVATPELIKSTLISTCRDVTSGVSAHGNSAEPGHDLATGAGFVDAVAACQRLRQTFS